MAKKMTMKQWNAYFAEDCKKELKKFLYQSKNYETMYRKMTKSPRAFNRKESDTLENAFNRLEMKCKLHLANTETKKKFIKDIEELAKSL